MSNVQKKTIMWPLALGVLVLLTMPSVWAQSSAITGTVTDATQAVLPGVDVEVTNEETGVTRSLVSNDLGRYSARLQTGTELAHNFGGVNQHITFAYTIRLVSTDPDNTFFWLSHEPVVTNMFDRK